MNKSINPVAEAIRDTLVSPNETDQNLESANVVDGLFAVARAINRVAEAIRLLGFADAATPMGAIEAFGVVVRDGLDRVAGAIENTSNGG